MSRSSRYQINEHRPLPVRVAIGLLVFLGLTAFGGGVEMLLFPTGNEFVPGEWLDHIPIVETWVLPGLVLGIIFGVGSLLAAAGLLWRPRWTRLHRVESATDRHWSWIATVLLGIGLLAWIGLEVILLPERDLIELLYAAIAIALIVLAWNRTVRAWLSKPG
jgi:hypothetical protein